MTPRRFAPRTAYVAALFAVTTPLLAGGCAEDAYASGQAAYPQPAMEPADSPGLPPSGGQPIGTTIAPSAPPEEVVAAAQPPAPTEPPPPATEAPAPQDPQADEGYADTDPSALQDFRGALNPYGNWVEDPTYGTVWVPSASVVGSDFTPYVTAGHWAYGDDYVWVSDYEWGWAPFHYGRWVYAGPTGWAWIPGRSYAGAWVSWRYGVGDWGYVGWAPLAPTWGWRGGVAYNYGFVPRMPYAFCASGNLFAPQVGAGIVRGPQVGAIAANTRPWTGSGLGGRVTARPSVGGPPPSVLHVSPSSVTGVGANRGVAQARGFARPSTALPLGGSAPRVASVTSPYRAPSPAPSPYRAPSPEPSHFGGRLGAGFRGSPAAAPRPYYGYGGWSGGYSPAPAARGYAGRPYGAGAGFSGYSAPHYSAPHYFGGGSSGAYHGGGSVHVGGGGGSFHTSGGGGFHGGGGRSGGHR
jgi:hypothetical protein